MKNQEGDRVGIIHIEIPPGTHRNGLLDGCPYCDIRWKHIYKMVRCELAKPMTLEAGLAYQVKFKGEKIIVERHQC